MARAVESMLQDRRGLPRPDYVAKPEGGGGRDRDRDRRSRVALPIGAIVHGTTKPCRARSASRRARRGMVTICATDCSLWVYKG